MPREEFVIRLSEDSTLYCIGYTTTFNSCIWGNVDNAVVWETLAEAEAAALAINSGTVGTSKPKD